MVWTLQENVLRFLERNINIILSKQQNIPFYISEKIFRYLDRKNFGIFEENLNYFASEKTPLHHLKFNGRRINNLSSFSFLQYHSPKYLFINGVQKFGASEWIQYVNCKNLTELTITNCLLCKINTNEDKMKFLNSFIPKFCLYKLTKIDFSWTDFNDNCLEFICKFCLNIEDLNISYTNVRRLQSLTNLTKLIKFNYHENSCCLYDYEELDYLLELDNLCHLSISYNTTRFRRIPLDWLKKILIQATWTRLEHIFITGRYELDENVIK